MSINITEANYSLFNAKNFFGGTDIIRIVIIVYIFVSFILNVINFLAIGIVQFKKKEFPISILLTSSILLVNLIHTCAYVFEWVIKKEITTVEISKGEEKIEVGGLLVGNPSNFAACYSQAFILISSSISQDFIINIFFFLLKSNEKQYKKNLIILIILILGIVFPIAFTLILYFEDALGINDEFCYVAKFKFDIIQNNITHINEVEYYYNDTFQMWVIIVYAIRVFNFFVTLYFLVRIIIFIKKTNQDKRYIFKSITIPIIQLFTILIGVIYRLLNYWSPNKSGSISWLYLVLNTSDGIFIPIFFLFKNNIFDNFNRYFSGDILIEGIESESENDDD